MNLYMCLKQCLWVLTKNQSKFSHAFLQGVIPSSLISWEVTTVKLSLKFILSDFAFSKVIKEEGIETLGTWNLSMLCAITETSTGVVFWIP